MSHSERGGRSAKADFFEKGIAKAKKERVESNGESTTFTRGLAALRRTTATLEKAYEVDAEQDKERRLALIER